MVGRLLLGGKINVKSIRQVDGSFVTLQFLAGLIVVKKDREGRKKNSPCHSFIKEHEPKYRESQFQSWLANYLEDTNRMTHGTLYVETLDILPVLLEQGNEEIDRHHHIGQKFIFRHGNMSNGNTQAKNLL